MKTLKAWILLPVILLIMLSIVCPVEAFTSQEKKFIENNKKLRLRLEEEREKVSLRPAGKIKVYNIVDREESVELDPEEYRIGYQDRLEYWRVQVFATESKEKAANIDDDLKSDGFSGISVIQEDDLYKVRAGKFLRREEALSVADSLREEGWEAWVDRKHRDNTLFISQGEEFVFAAPGLRFSGEVSLNGNLYPGEFEFVRSGTGFNIYNTAGLQTVLSGYMSGLEDVQGEKFGSVLRARAVAARSSLMARTFQSDQGFLVLPEYRGIDEVDDKIRAAVNHTSGIVLKKEGEVTAPEGISPILLAPPENGDDEFHLYNLARVFVLAERGLDYRGILSNLYLDLDLVDLSQEVEREERVNASIFYGLKYREVWDFTWWGPRVVGILDLDLNRRNFSVNTVLAGDRIFGTEPLQDLVGRSGALAGINGTYYRGDGSPLGLIISEGDILSEPVHGRSALGINRVGEVFIDRTEWEGELSQAEDISLRLDGVNREPSSGEAVLINSAYGNEGPDLQEGTVELIIEDGVLTAVNSAEKETAGGPVPEDGFLVLARGQAAETAIEFSAGENIEYSNHFSAERWNNQEIVTALGAGPNLVTGGEVNITGEEERFQPDILYGRAPRSGLGVTGDDHLLLFTVDGRQAEVSVGMTLNELAEFMVDFGVEQGMNLDGGDSARMVVRGYTMSRPSRNRNVSSGLVISR